jgi:hypothetical protein
LFSLLCTFGVAPEFGRTDHPALLIEHHLPTSSSLNTAAAHPEITAIAEQNLSMIRSTLSIYQCVLLTADADSPHAGSVAAVQRSGGH